MGVFSGFDERVLPLCDFSKLESSIGEWENIGEWESSERVLALWASSHRAEENGSLPRFSRKSGSLPKEYWHYGRVLKTLPREQKRRMGVFSGFGERVLPFCDFSKLESSIGEWFSRKSIAIFGKSIGIMGEFSKLFRESRSFPRCASYCEIGKTGEQHRRMGVFRT